MVRFLNIGRKLLSDHRVITIFFESGGIAFVHSFFRGSLDVGWSVFEKKSGAPFDEIGSTHYISVKLVGICLFF